MSEWISVKDKEPPFERVLVLWTKKEYERRENGVTTANCKPKYWVDIAFFVPGKWTRIGEPAFSDVKVGYEITHWMPLPESPKEEV